jgi:Carboxypeptidase regulatory-like domain
MDASKTREFVRRALSHHPAWAAITRSWIAGSCSRQQNPPRLKTMNRSGAPLNRFIVASPRALAAFSVWIAMFGAGSPAMAQEHLAQVAGSVTVTDAEGKSYPAAGVRLILKCWSEPFPRTEISDAGGAFRFDSVPVGPCRIVTDLQGFRSATAEIEADVATRLQFLLTIEPVFGGITVTGRAVAGARIKRHHSCKSTRSRRSSGSPEAERGR